MRNRALVTLLTLSAALLACSKAPKAPPKPRLPDMPASVPPDWKLTTVVPSAPPDEVPKDGKPECWMGTYTGSGGAQVWLCRYSNTTTSFDAAQRVHTEAQTVKFQEGTYLVLVMWNDAPISDLTALVRAVQNTMSKK